MILLSYERMPAYPYQLYASLRRNTQHCTGMRSRMQPYADLRRLPQNEQISFLRRAHAYAGLRTAAYAFVRMRTAAHGYVRMRSTAYDSDLQTAAYAKADHTNALKFYLKKRGGTKVRHTRREK